MGEVVNIDVDVRRLRLRPGDALVVQLKRDATAGDARTIAENVAAWLQRAGAPPTPVLILNDGSTIAQVRFEDAKAVLDEAEAAGRVGPTDGS